MESLANQLLNKFAKKLEASEYDEEKFKHKDFTGMVYTNDGKSWGYVGNYKGKEVVRGNEVFKSSKDAIEDAKSDIDDWYKEFKQESLEESNLEGANVGGEVKRYLTQFTTQGNARRAVGTTIPVLEAGVYRLQSDMSGIYFEKTAIKSDGLIRFKDERYESLLTEAKKFWAMKEDFKKVGMNYQRGILLEGGPGGGKSCILKLMMEDVIAGGDVIFLSDNPRLLTEALKQFKEIETERNVMVVIEEVDEIISYNQRAMSELLDGQDKVDGVLFVATTNHIERIHPKFLREGRFDLKINIGMPPKSGRVAYLKEKIGLVEAENIIEEIADATDGFSFAQMREYVISVYCYKKDPKQVVARIKTGKGLDESVSEDYENVTDKEICEGIVYYYYYAQDPVRSTKQFASNRNTTAMEANDMASKLIKKFGAKSDAQENLEEADSLRKKLPHGYKSHSGVVWSNSQVDKYNDIQDQINDYIKKGQKPPENLLNGSHNLMVSFSQKDK